MLQEICTLSNRNLLGRETLYRLNSLKTNNSKSKVNSDLVKMDDLFITPAKFLANINPRLSVICIETISVTSLKR